MTEVSGTPRSADQLNLELLAIILVAAMSCAVFARNLFVDNSVVFHDEYVYKVSADRLLDQDMVIVRGLAPRMPNRLFLAVYGFGSYFGSNYYVFAQLLNVAFWALGLLLFHRVAIESGLSRRRALVYLAAAGLLPLSAYTKYFMPEAMFFALVAGSVYALMVGLQRRIDAPLIIAGVLVGLLYFVKPHALVLAAGNLAFLLLLPERVRNGSLFGLGVAITMAVGKVALGRAPAGASDLGFYEEVLLKVLARFEKTQVLAGLLAEVSVGHALFLLCGFGLPLLVMLATLAPRLRLLEKAAPLPVWLASAYLVTTGALLLGMSVSFTALADNELGRIHSRYYSFLYPLGLLLLFHFAELRLTRVGRGVGLALAAAGPLLVAIFGAGYSAVLPISLVADCPEWGFVFLSTPVRYFGLAALAAAGVWAVLRPEKTSWLLGAWCVTSVLSGVDVMLKQKGMYRNVFATGREAVAVEELLGRERMATAVVVGEDRGVVSKFLFYLSTTPMAEEVPYGGSLEAVGTKYPRATHVIVLTPGYVMPPTLQCNPGISGIKICSIIR